MAVEYPANTSIIKAIPTLLANNVQTWTITYRMTHTAANSYVWSWDWGYHHDVSALNKTRAEFTTLKSVPNESITSTNPLFRTCFFIFTTFITYKYQINLC